MTRMKTFTMVAALLASAVLVAAAESKNTRVFEMRTYYAHPGKLDDLNKRFRDHTVRLFEKHGMENIGYWTPIPNTNNVLIYVLAHKSMEAAAASWKAFGGDPDWKSAQKASEANGPLVRKADRSYMRATDYSPEIKVSQSAMARVFELRDYTASDGNMAGLDGRFRDHTLKLFTKHGMENVGYWHPVAGKDGKERMVYILAYPNKEAAATAWSAFRKDPDWVAAKDASEKKAGGSLTASNGVVSIYLTPTDYSPTK
jgi:hypothetical protein